MSERIQPNPGYILGRDVFDVIAKAQIEQGLLPTRLEPAIVLFSGVASRSQACIWLLHQTGLGMAQLIANGDEFLDTAPPINNWVQYIQRAQAAFDTAQRIADSRGSETVEATDLAIGLVETHDSVRELLSKHRLNPNDFAKCLRMFQSMALSQP